MQLGKLYFRTQRSNTPVWCHLFILHLFPTRAASTFVWLSICPEFLKAWLAQTIVNYHRDIGFSTSKPKVSANHASSNRPLVVALTVMYLTYYNLSLFGQPWHSVAECMNAIKRRVFFQSIYSVRFFSSHSVSKHQVRINYERLSDMNFHISVINWVWWRISNSVPQASRDLKLFGHNDIH